MKQALVFYGGWDGHQPKEFAAIAKQYLEQDNYTVTVKDSLECLTDDAFMSTLDLIVPLWTMGEIEREQEAGLIKAVEAGCGLAGWHGGMGDSFRKATDYQFMVGGQFVGHPGNIIDYTVTIKKHDDPIMQGLNDFAVHSEQYYMHVDPSNEVLATTTFSGEHMPWVEGVVMPVVWKRHWGKGRVFYSSLGHHTPEFDTPEVQTIVKRGLAWATRV